MVNKIYTKDWFGRIESDYIYNPLDKMKGIIQIPNHKYSSFLYNEDKAERICSDINLMKREINDMIHAIGLSNVNVGFSKDNETASTNGKYIEIGIGDDYQNIDDCYEKLDRIIGMAIHESCHCLYTDFNCVYDVVHKYPSIVHHIHNVIEDEIIERKLCVSYPGYQNFLNKLKYNIFEKNSESIEDTNKNSEIDDVLEILFYIIRYPKFISKINTNILSKYESLFSEIKKIMGDNDCFNINNVHPTKSSINAAIEIYELIKDLIEDELLNNDISNDISNDTDGESNNDTNGDSNNDSKNNDNNGESNNDSKNNDSKANDTNGNSNNDTNGDSNNDSKTNGSKNNDTNNEFIDSVIDSVINSAKIIVIMTNVLNDISSESEQTNIYDLREYHTEIEKSMIDEINNFTWEKTGNNYIDNIDINIWNHEDKFSYNAYKKEVTQYINEAKKLIIPNSKKTIIVNSRFNRNGTLDPTRLANAMCNEQTVYIRKESKQIDNEPEYALCIMLDESGSMTDNGINLLASKIAIMLYEAMQNYPKIKLFVYGHGDTVYKYIDIKNCKNKYVLANRRQQYSQDELQSYKLIVDDIKSQTKLPIIMFNITDSCYCSNEAKLHTLVNELKNDKKQKTFINLICLGHNEYVDHTVKNWNDLIYGKGNWVLYNKNKLTSEWHNTIKNIANIIHKTIKI